MLEKIRVQATQWDANNSILVDGFELPGPGADGFGTKLVTPKSRLGGLAVVHMGREKCWAVFHAPSMLIVPGRSSGSARNDALKSGSPYGFRLLRDARTFMFDIHETGILSDDVPATREQVHALRDFIVGLETARTPSA